MLIRHFSYHHAFLLFGAVAAACAVLFAIGSRALSDGQTRVVSLRNVRKADLVQLAGGPFLVVVLLGISMEAFNYHTLNQLFPNLARDVHGVSETAISRVVALGRLPAVGTLLVLAYFIDRVSPLRVYGVGLALAGLCVAAQGSTHGMPSLVTAYFGFYLFHGAVWGSNSASINAVVPPRLRDSAFAIMSVVALAAVVVVGLIHNRLLAAGMALPHVFTLCGAMASAAGALLFAYSFSAHARRESAEVRQPSPEAV